MADGSGKPERGPAELRRWMRANGVRTSVELAAIMRIHPVSARRKLAGLTRLYERDWAILDCYEVQRLLDLRELDRVIEMLHRMRRLSTLRR